MVAPRNSYNRLDTPENDDTSADDVSKQPKIIINTKM